MIYNTSDTISYICMARDTNADIEVNNVSIKGLDGAVYKVRDGAIYVGGMAATAKVVKNSSLPLGAKLGATIGMGAASLIGFKMVQNNLSSSTTQGKHGKLDIKADKISSVIKSTSSKSSSNNNVSKLIDNTDNSGNNVNDTTISQLDI